MNLDRTFRKILTVIATFGILLVVTNGSFVVKATGQNGTTLSADKTAVANLTNTFHWTIDKSVTPTSWNLFNGDTGTSDYTVTVIKDSGTLASNISGQICVTNGGAVATVGLAITDNVTMPPSETVIASTSVDLSLHPILQPGESFCYSYNVPIVSPVAGATYKDTADVTITNHSGHLDTPFGPNPSATSVMPATPVVVNGSVNVDDTNGSSWLFNASGSQTYSKTFACGEDAGVKNNTATIRETGQSDSASVTINCFDPTVTKTANTSFNRTYGWTINKTGDQTNLTLALGEIFTVNYSVSVNTTGFTDSNWAVSGNIVVHNPAPINATINSVTDLMTGDIAGNVSCGVTFPYTLVAGGDLNCTYSSALPDASSRVNTANATQQNYSYSSAGVATPEGTTDYTGTANVDFSKAAITNINTCVNVTDTFGGSLGTVCTNDSLPKIYTYSRQIGPFSICGPNTIVNTATISTETSSLGSSTWTVNANVPCVLGCTLTQGYWKTHNNSFKGGAPIDLNWNNITPGAETSPFFLSGNTWFGVFWTVPKGNVYYNLADQYMAAKLNVLNGASPLVITPYLLQAQTLFGFYTPAQIGAMKANNPVRTQFINLAGILGNYNEGLIGPGHCSEQTN